MTRRWLLAVACVVACTADDADDALDTEVGDSDDTDHPQDTDDILDTDADQAPTVAFTAPTDGSVVAPAAVTLALMVTDETPDMVSVEVSSDRDGRLGSARSDLAGVATLDVTLSSGLHTLTATATDAGAQSATASRMVRANGAPTAPVVSIIADSARTADDLDVRIDAPSSDVEGDPITLAWAWSRDGVPQPSFTTSTVPSSATAKGQTWTVTLTPSDPYQDGPAGTDEINIGNTPPESSGIRIDPAAPVALQRMTCVSSATDADLDAVSTSFAWFDSAGGSLSTRDTLDVDPNVLAPGDTVRCVATHDDGTDAVSDEVSVTIENSAPRTAIPVVVPDLADTQTDLTCLIAYVEEDDVGQSVGITFEWFIDGVAVAGSAQTQTLSASFHNATTRSPAAPRPPTASGSPARPVRPTRSPS